MPLPQLKPSEFDKRQAAGPQTDHYFDTVHGDVAALHARIEQGFGDYDFERAPHSPLGNRLEDSIRTLSRAAGIFGLLGAVALIAYALI